MKTKKFCGIFTAAFAIATVITLASCNQDDEYYYDSEMFTRADGMMTRDEFSIYYNSGRATTTASASGVIINFEVSWDSGLWSTIRPQIKYISQTTTDTYQTYIDADGSKVQVPDVVYINYETGMGPQIHFDQIIMSDLCFQIRKAQKVENEDGSYIYTLGKIESVSATFEPVNISIYRR